MIIAEGKAADKKRGKGQCMVVGCFNLGEKDPRRKKRTSLCVKHRYEQQIANSPCRHCYRHLKGSAKRRNKVFTITFEYFEQWCAETGYIEKRGRKAGYFTVDRIDDTKGYEPGNLQIMEHTANTRKQYIDKWLMQKYGSGGGMATREEAYDECYWNMLAEEQGWPAKSVGGCAEEPPF